MTIQELKSLHHFCDLKSNHLLIIVAMSVQIPQSVGYLLTRNICNFFHVEGSPAWLSDGP